MAINARGTFLCFKYAGMQMISQGRGGRIIGACSVGGKKGLVSSINRNCYKLKGFLGEGGQMTSAYCASKFAIRGLTQSAGMLIHRLIASHKRGVDTIKPANTGVTGLR